MSLGTITRRTVAYIRVSTDDQANDGNSLSDQERQTRAQAIARDWPEVAEVYSDPGVSGATRNRPSLNRLLADAKAGMVGRVIVTKLDRMSRRAADLLAIEDELDQCGVERLYIKDGIDTTTPVGRLLRTVLAAVAELERDMILERTSAGRVEAVRRGDVWRPRGVLGYTYLPVDKAAGLKGRVEIDPDTSPLVQRIFRDVASGVPLRTVAARLNAEGVPPTAGGAMWRHNAVQRIIQNPIYMGQAAYGRLHRVKMPGGKTALRANDPAKVQYVSVPALVTDDLARAAQEQMTRNRVMATRNATRDYLLGGGLIRCGALLPNGSVCQSVMHGESHRGTLYRCNHQAAEGQRRHSIPVDALDAAVWDALQRLLLNPETVLADVEAAASDGDARKREASADLARLERTLTDVETQRGRLLDLYLAGHLDQASYSAKAADLDARRVALHEQHKDARTRVEDGAAMALPTTDARALCALLAPRLEGLTFAQRRHLVRLLVDSIVATREVVEIEGAFESVEAISASDGAIVDQTSAHYAPRRRRPPGRA